MGQEPTGRSRDAARTRERLLRAARELMAERGFDRTTVRDIGERAGVDPALIARYYGGKAALCVAALRAESEESPPADLLDEERMLELLDRVGRHGPGPVFRCAVQPSGDSALDTAARAELDLRMVAPLRDAYRRDGVEGAQLRAEVATAAFIGVTLARRAGLLGELAAADTGVLAELLQELLRP
ncbi:TetR/AcrR family transcriptional regulator [Streptacidiphilus sp. ASG 303]|uniref:TetR/AcrR family transcriptional regulator n=1 Tax=Streptacidiphilus sp. ASG 303 TaxID=2896847 RepID=UPI001E36AE9C|nr:TetR/AcrR family transcriptional regulator [Streptacidiphilus sp. ASG 303]MCD0483726.1 TetR/AcrR family transcriptional regulator [Streptacidiphilus sp. ASG 303]